MTYRVGIGKWLFSVLMATLLIAFVYVGPVGAHGGAGDHPEGPAPIWMIVLLYIQFFTIPFVGFWLIREAVSAWLPLALRIGMEMH